jgi:hypothetical protein
VRPRAWSLVLAVVLALTAIPFFASTTFLGDDHLFLAFSRYAPHPFLPFVTDQHGGEFYRPLPMALWWLLGRLGDGTALPFKLAAVTLHALVAVLAGRLGWRLASQRQVLTGTLAALLFFLAPATREAAYWYSASTDLLATAGTLGSILALLAGKRWTSLLLAAAAYLSKESALVLPLLAAAALFARGGEGASPVCWKAIPLAVAPHVALGAAYFAVRWQVLGGLGGYGEERASLPGKLVQLSSGLLHVVTGHDLVPQPVAWGCGAAFLGLGALGLVRRLRRREPGGEGRRWAILPWLWTALAVLPLFAVGWIVGARYFYLPAVGLAWLAASSLAPLSPAVTGVILLALAALGGLQGARRSHEVASYDRRVQAAQRAVRDGLRHGHRIFHIASGVKDLDLAVKEAPDLRPLDEQVLVLSDVPASFVLLPATLAEPASFLVAAPPIPPAGAYRFGSRRIVGLARRGDDPTLNELVARFPDVRFIRLRASPGGRVIPRDVTEELKQTLE